MDKCPYPHHKRRSDLPQLTPRIAALPVDERGYPVPFFVQWLDENNNPAPPGTGRPEFRMMDRHKLSRCIKEKLCWVCGEKLGVHMAFPIGPMCAVNKVTSEPPSHLECATWSVKGCPFLSRPKMVRREDEFTDAHQDNVAGVAILRNPGVIAIWVTRSYEPFRVPTRVAPDGTKANPGVLINIGPPETIEWWTEGRRATRDEVRLAIDTGIPALLEVCQTPEETDECQKAVAFVLTNYLPKE